MLLELHIRDFALIHRLHIDFTAGFNVLSGETGAGKSIVVDALQTALGGRARSELVRSGQEVACIEAVFRLGPDHPARLILADMDVIDEAEPDTLVLRRDVLRTGRSRSRINGHRVTVTQLAAVGTHLVDIHGQHDAQSLLRTAEQMALLDAYGGRALLDLRQRFADTWSELTAARAELRALRDGERERARRLDLIRFQLNEIREAGPDVAEEEQLERQQKRLAHLERLHADSTRVYALLEEGGNDGPGAAVMLADAAETLHALAALDPDLNEATKLVADAEIRLREAASLLRDYVDGLDADPSTLDEVQSRLSVLSTLKRKYGPTVADVIAFAERLDAELATLEGSDTRGERLAAETKRLTNEAAELASELSAARAEAARRLEGAVSEELAGLHMGPARFVITVKQRPADDGLPVAGETFAAAATGIDRVEFLLSANPGQQPRSLARIASGGELSRVALALKRTLARVDPVPTLVFDEVDAGIGGRTAQAVGDRLAAVAEQRQVICVTHLAQIAALADHHLHIHKASEEDTTDVHVSHLTDDARVREIARMMAGTVTDSTLQHAREMLALA